MMDRNEISQTLRSDNLMWGQPITAIQLDSSKIDAWFDEFIDTETLCTEEFEFSNCKTSNGVDKNYTIDYRVPMDIVYDEFSLVHLKYHGLTSMKRMDSKMHMTTKEQETQISLGATFIKQVIHISYLRTGTQLIVITV